MVKIIVSGIGGRMGSRIAFLSLQDKNFELVGALESSGNPAIGKDIGDVLGLEKIGTKVTSDFSKATGQGAVLIEFTAPDATIQHLDIAAKNKIAMVIGTTALSEDELQKIRAASGKIPIVFSPNMSIGANLLFLLTENVAKSLGKEYEVEIVEAHHSKKKDAPSGTAKKLGEIVSKSRGKMPPIHSIRTGDIVGDHTVIFAGQGERIELTHRAHSRDAFAKGALDAAKFLVGKKPRLYSMQDVIWK